MVAEVDGAVAVMPEEDGPVRTDDARGTMTGFQLSCD